jgi:hypothetical protein
MHGAEIRFHRADAGMVECRKAVVGDRQQEAEPAAVAAGDNRESF